MQIWCQWPDVTFPQGVTSYSGSLDETPLEEIEFFVPRYTGAALEITSVAKMPKLRVLQLPNAGYEDALPYAREGLTICNARGVHDASTAEMAIGLTIAALRGIPDFVRAKDAGQWAHDRYPALADKSVAVIGYGSIGKRIARLLTAFEANVVAFSRSGRDGSLPIDQLDRKIAEFDVIIVIAPATPETRHLINASRLSAMKQGALVVNVARGSLVDTDALNEALRSGQVHAALDVTDPEPLPAGHPLWSAPNLLISPHVGGDTSAFEPRMRALIERQVARYLNGEPLENIVA